MKDKKLKGILSRPLKHKDIYDRLDIYKQSNSDYGAIENGIPGSEDFESEQPETGGPLSRFPSVKFSKPALFCFLLFIIASILFQEPYFRGRLWASGDTVFNKGEYWRLVTSLFIHGDIIHLLSNTLFFLIFGWFLRAFFGLFVFPAASILTGIISSAVTLSIYNPHTRLIGASGMIYGMVALWLIFYIRYDIEHTVPVRIFRALGFILVMLIPTTIHPATSYISHAAGFGVGIFMAVLLLPFIKIKMDEVKDHH